jgi:hypothetical protein
MGSLRSLAHDAKEKMPGYEIIAICEPDTTNQYICLEWESVPRSTYDKAQEMLKSVLNENNFCFFFDSLSEIPEEFDYAEYFRWNFKHQDWLCNTENLLSVKRHQGGKS